MTDEELRLILRLRDEALRAREAVLPSMEAAFGVISQWKSAVSMLAEMGA